MTQGNYSPGSWMGVKARDIIHPAADLEHKRADLMKCFDFDASSY